MATNPYVNEVIYGGTTLISLKNDTVIRDDVRARATFHLPSGQTTTGTMPDLEATTYNVSGSDQIISSGKYVAGAQTIRGVKLTDGTGSTTINANNVRDGVIIKVGDSGDDDRILAVTGTFTDSETITGAGISAAGAAHILSGRAAFIDGAQVNGSIPSKAAATYNVSSNNQTISSGQYLSGTQTIRGVTTAGISAANVKYGVAVKVGDSADDDRIIGVTGTFTKASTVSSGQTAATASQMLSGYSAWVDGAEVKGSIAAKTSADMTVSGATVTAPAGYYATAASKSVASGSAATPATTITSNPQLSVSDAGVVSASVSTSKSITPTVSEGYVSAGTAGTVTVSGSNTLTLSAPIMPNRSVTATILGSLSIDSDTGVASVAYIDSYGEGEYDTYYSEIYADNFTHGWLTEVNWQSEKIDGVIGLDPTSAQLPVQAAATITPTESAQTAVAKGKWTTGAVTVAAIPSNYVGSGITRRSSSDLTASGATVTVPAGYYSAQATKAIASGSAKTPATTVTANPTFSFDSATGVLTATASATKSVTPTVTAGYVSSGTAGTITVSGSNTYTVTASELTYGVTTVRDYGEGPIALRGTFVIGTGYATMRTLAAASFSNVATTGTTYVDISATTEAPVLVSGSYLFINRGYVDDLKISLAKLVPDGASADLASNKILQGYSAYDRDGALIAGSIASKAAATYTPTTSDQTITAGQYLSGAQTIKGDANLVAGNIKAGVSLFGLTGTHQGGQISYTETDNSAGGKTVTIVFTGDD